MDDKILPMPTLGSQSKSSRSLPSSLQHNLETAHGINLSDVKVHVGHQATMVGALSFTQGNDIYLAPAQANNLNLVAHECAHVVQQKRERIANVAKGLVAVDIKSTSEEAE